MIGKTSGCKAARSLVLRAVAIAAMLGAALQPLGCAAGSDEQPVTLSIANASGEPLRCMIMFAHFVVTDAGTIRPNAELSIALFRQDSDGALWIPRADGRRMMIETIDCGSAARWAETRGQISLLPARAGREPRYGTTCRLRGMVTCEGPKPLP